ncbi:MAG: glycosyltransferase family 2 protein [Chloroflexi bacterium]|nr:glycosyltransferase family 2 protein [Chloroflexota bacterium]
MPTVSVIIPCRDEARFIRRCLDSIIANNYSKDMLEILVVDAMSEDGTRAIVEAYARRYPFIRLVDNPKRITPAALNLGIAQAKGTIIVRMDAHSEYFSDYLAKSVMHLEQSRADNVGGIRITKPSDSTFSAKAVALVTSYPFGTSRSRYRFSSRGCFVDTVPNGAFRREIFDRIGYFNEELVRNQDNEFNARIISNGGSIFLSPEIKSYYYNQATIHGLLKQALITGMWNVSTVRINAAAFRWRHFTPFVFVTALLVLGPVALLHSGAQFAFFILVSLYVSATAVSSLQIGLREGIEFAILLPVLFFLYHLCYGLGTWVGFLQMAVGLWDAVVLHLNKLIHK